jgi:surface protein
MSYAALYKGTTPIINLAAGSGGGGPWVRPAWPALADLTSTDNVFTAIYGVDSTDSNFVALAVTTSSGTYTVDWGDGTIDTGIASNVQANHTYDYATIAASVVENYKPVVVTVTTSGGNIITFDLQRINPLNTSSSASVVNWLDIAINASEMNGFYLASVDPTIFLVRLGALRKATIYNNSITSMYVMFNGCFCLESVSILHTAPTLETTARMFLNCRSLKSVPLFNTSAVTNMTEMFSGCSSLQSVPLFNTAAVTNMMSMFVNCRSLKSVPLFNTAAVTDMSSMFTTCYSLQSVPLFNTASVTNMGSMFSGCASLKSVPLFNTASVTNMTTMFSSCVSLQSVPLFNTAAVTLMGSMFTSCTALQSVPLFNTAAVTNMSSMFSACSSLQSVPLFNTAAVTTMSSMFRDCSSLSIIPSFNTSALIASGTTFKFLNSFSLCQARTNGLKFSINYTNLKLSTAALNDVFTGLGTASGTQTINIIGNPGTATCTRSIATDKGWTVTG